MPEPPPPLVPPEPPPEIPFGAPIPEGAVLLVAAQTALSQDAMDYAATLRPGSSRLDVTVSASTLTLAQANALWATIEPELDGILVLFLGPDFPQRVNYDGTHTCSLDSWLMWRSAGSDGNPVNRYRWLCYTQGAKHYGAEAQAYCNGMVLVGRIDGLELAHVKTNMDNAVDGLELAGLCQVDRHNFFGLLNGRYDAWDLSHVAPVAAAMAALGYTVQTDLLGEGSPRQAGGANVGCYAGWYAGSISSRTYAQGAVAMEVHSFSASNLKTAGTYAGRFLSEGVAATYGTVDEPYLDCYPPPNEVLAFLQLGFTWVEAVWAAAPFTGEQVSSYSTAKVQALGVPTFRPFVVEE